MSVAIDLQREPPQAVQIAAFRIVAEALTNVRKHAHADNVVVEVTDRTGTLQIVVTDDGVGLDNPSTHPGHLGIPGMMERAEALGGRCTIVRGPAAQGTQIRASVPLFELSSPLTPLPWEEIAASTEVDTLRRERDSLTVAAAEARDRASDAEGRLRQAIRLSKALLERRRSIDDIAAVAAEHIGACMRDGCAVHLLSDDGVLLVRHASWHSHPARREVLNDSLFTDRARGDGHMGTVIRSGETILVEADSMAGLSLTARPHGVHSAIVSPIRFDTDIIGTVTVVRDDTRAPFDLVDSEFVGCLADQVSVALTLVGGVSYQ